MRRWYLGSAAIVSVGVAAAFLFLSSGKAQEGQQPEKQAVSKIAKSKIDKVTVYPNSALVTREIGRAHV